MVQIAPDSCSSTEAYNEDKPSMVEAAAIEPAPVGRFFAV
jgi:hypothetical protein